MSSKVSKPSQSAGTRAPARTRASVACINCRLRKIKCDVQNQPPGSDCTQCRNTNAPCYTDSGGDRRNRLAELEDLLGLHGARNAESERVEQRPQSSRYQDARHPAPSGTSPPLVTANPAPPPDTGLMSAELAGGSLLEDHSVQILDGQLPTPQPPDFSSLAGECQNMFDMLLDSTERSMTTLGQPGCQLDNNVFSPADDAIRQLGIQQPHFHNMAPPRTGEPQTSDFETQQSYQLPQTSLLADFDDSASVVGDDNEEETSLGIDSAPLRTALLQTFWDVHPCGILVVEKEPFMTHRSIGKRSHYYSTFLEDAILSSASRVSTSSFIRQLGAQFLERARAQVLQEIENPNIASMQGLTLLSECVGITGNDRLSWIYCGMACRLVFDLGLLHKKSNTLNDEGDVVDASHRIASFLSTFVFDQNLSLYFGRPHSMTLAQLRSALQGAKNTSIPEILQAWSLLSVQVSRITDVLNTATSADVTNQLHLFPKLAAEIDACYESLPPQLKCDDLSHNDLNPHSYGLNLQFCGVRIILHRLWNRLLETTEGGRSHAAAGPSGVVGTEQQQCVNQSARIIYQNAIRVARLTRTYKLIYGVEKLVTVMLINTSWATTALISHILSSPSPSPSSPHPGDGGRRNGGNDSDTNIYWLKFLWKTLEESQPYYPLAAPILRTFARLIEGTHLHTILRARRFSNGEATSPSAIFTSSTENKDRGSVEALMHDVSYGLGSSARAPTTSDNMFVDFSMVDTSWMFN
ncbi:hypothetical protein AYO21_00812 [Fonsecaea monophora]|uniref:Zn(2)-C6 fungal-type domain-containing protein n=1 Tax=Fonsecaea monophora TaxID=254056 RepID=A0A177FMQ8_9EURO|nr:hypothetical protein AYO21_00812 [Fonsecaea monophora]OAG44850.1 hypothetical protein AYO21_00812 [Fonsecaea monophora]